MARREYTETPLSGGGVSFQTGAAPAPVNVSGVNFSSLQNSLQSWNARATEQKRLKGINVAQEEAIRRQGELGVGEMAQPDETWGELYKQAFREQAAEVFQQNLLNDADRVDIELQREHYNDPEGYLEAKRAYRDKTLQPIREQNIRLFESASNILDRQTNSTYTQIANRAFEVELQQNKEQATLNFETAATNAVQSLLEPGADRELIVAERTGDLYNQLAKDRDLGLINDVEYQQRLAGVDDTLYFASIRGDVQDALQTGNFGVVEGYIDDLNRGVGVTSNLDAARSLADEIRVDMNRTRTASGGQAKALMQAAQQEASILLAGGNPEEAGVAGSMRAFQTYSEQSGDPDLQRQERNMIADFNAATWVQEDLMTSDVDQLEEDIERFRNDPNLSDSFRQSVVENGTERVREVRAAQGDSQALRDLFPTASFQEVARIGDVDPAEVPTFSRAQIEEQLPAAMNRGDLYSALFDPEIGLMAQSRFGGNDLAETIVRTEGLTADQRAASVTAIKLFQNGATDVAEQVATLTGTLTSEQEQQFGTAFENADGATDLVDAISYGDPATRGLVQRGLALVASGRAAALGEVEPNAAQYRDIASQVVREMESRISLVDIAGRTYPAMDFTLPGEGPQEGAARARALGESIQAELEAQGKATTGVVLRPTENGGVQVFSNFGYTTLLTSPDGDTEWTFDEVADANDDARVEAARLRRENEEARATPEWADELNSRDPERYTQATLASVDAAIQQASQDSGVEEPLLRAVVAASDKLTPAVRAARDVPAEDDVIRMTDPRGAGNPIATRDMLPNIYVFEQGIEGGEFGLSEQAEWISTTQRQFDNDPRKVLAAYWAGREVVRTLVDEYGENWFDQASPNIKNFVRSGLQFYEREDFQYVPKAFMGTLYDPSKARAFDPSRRGM